MRRMNSGTGWRFTSGVGQHSWRKGTALHDDRHDGGAQYQFVARRAAPRTRSPCTSAGKQRSRSCGPKT